MGSEVELEPTGDRLIVELPVEDEVTEAGVIIPRNAMERATRGIVLACGPGRYSEMTGQLVAMNVKVGDEIFYSRYGGTELEHEGRKFLILVDGDVMVKFPRG